MFNFCALIEITSVHILYTCGIVYLHNSVSMLEPRPMVYIIIIHVHVHVYAHHNDLHCTHNIFSE